MGLLEKLKNINLEKIYLLSYVCVFSVMIFLRSSQFAMAMNGISSNHTWFYMLYILATLLGILINLFLSFCFYNKTKNKGLLLVSIVLFLLAVVTTAFGNPVMSLPYLVIFLFINNAILSNATKIMKYDFWMRVIIFLLIIFMYFFKLYPANTKVDILSRVNNLSVHRYSFGFMHPNALAIFVLAIFISFVIAYTDVAKRIYSILGISLIYVITFFLTDSRIFEVTGLILILGLICYNLRIIHKVINLCTIPVIVISMIVGCVYLYQQYLNSDFNALLNIISSNRLTLGIQALHYYPVKLLGYGSTPLLDVNKVNIDDMYMQYMVKFGFVGFLILQGYLYYCGYASKKSKNYFGNISMIIIALCIITLSTNVLFAPMLYIVSTYYRDKKEKNNEYLD